ncbi:uncharacterized protein LOC120194318 [Hibiscus syriacus]|uniref:uncharacterized protein LOC120194318 n=1 Tax=Hibiscus syriacus TaxID=106335 RepID=UPI00192344A8|nr:uncharacterized protein LOC120194318 [Hibiscus syriacus]
MGISISDNTLLAQEIVRGYSRKNLSPRCAIKVDLQKAFDSISWEFLLNVLDAMGLPQRGARGVRQGDPLSPYLFVIVMKFLSSLLDVAVRNVLGVLSILDKFYDLSGLKLNAMKTEIFTCGIPRGELEQIRIATCFRVGHLPVRYLGVPLVTRKLSGTDCRALLDNIKGKLRQLILPKGVIQDIERVYMRFFWKGNDSPAHGARVSWSHICSPKSEGGLGLRSLVGWNQACCLMLIKNLLADEGSLWIAWVKAYCFKHEDYWNVESKPHFSWTLRKLIKMRVQAGSLFTASVNWLPTKERLARFAVVSDARCGFCDDDLESRNHLFSDCPY